MFKNVRYLYKMLGTTDISSIGNGIITGTISTLNSNLTAPSIIASQTIVYDDSNNTGCTMRRYSNGIVVCGIHEWTKYSTLKQIVGIILPEKFRPLIFLLNFLHFFQSGWTNGGFTLPGSSFSDSFWGAYVIIDKYNL